MVLLVPEVLVLRVPKVLVVPEVRCRGDGGA